jgi:hypothetical protein
MSAVAIETESQMALKAVIIFDNLALAARAVTTLENAATGAGETVKWDIKSWQADVLKRPDFTGVTVAVAADADLVVLALDKMRSASDELLDWLEHWSEHRKIEDAAILAFCPDDSPKDFFNELKWFAEWRGLDFLENRDNPENVIRLGRLMPHVVRSPVPEAALVSAGE